jgi:hypothetical protein
MGNLEDGVYKYKYRRLQDSVRVEIDQATGQGDDGARLG